MIVQECVVEPVGDRFQSRLKHCEIRQDIDGIELLALKVDLHIPVMAVERFDRAVGEPKLVRRGEFTGQEQFKFWHGQVLAGGLAGPGR